MSKYFIDLKGLAHEKITFEASFESGVVDFGTENVQQVGSLDWSASAERTGDEIRIAGSLNTAVELPCSRCLEPARIPITKPFDLFFRQRDEEMFDEDETWEPGERDETRAPQLLQNRASSFGNACPHRVQMIATKPLLLLV